MDIQISIINTNAENPWDPETDIDKFMFDHGLVRLTSTGERNGVKIIIYSNTRETHTVDFSETIPVLRGTCGDAGGHIAWNT